MLTKEQIDSLLNKVSNASKIIVGKDLDSVTLYGSYARGDFDEESDVDILLKIRCTPEELINYEEPIAQMCSDLSLEYDIMISIHTVSLDVFNRFKKALPFYANIEKEGIRVDRYLYIRYFR